MPGAAGSQRLLQRVHELRNREEYDDPMQLTDSLRKVIAMEIIVALVMFGVVLVIFGVALDAVRRAK